MTCNGKKITVDGREYVLVDPSDETDVVLVRTTSAGVHVGVLKARSGREVTLMGAHRIWRWKGANTLNELAARGGDTGYTRISEAVPEITLLDAIEVIPCGAEAAKNLRLARWPG